MNQIIKNDFNNEITRELDEVRAAAIQARDGLRTLRDIEMGWVGGGDAQPIIY